jgi:hypothetical protein
MREFDDAHFGINMPREQLSNSIADCSVFDGRLRMRNTRHLTNLKAIQVQHMNSVIHIDAFMGGTDQD